MWATTLLLSYLSVAPVPALVGGARTADPAAHTSGPAAIEAGGGQIFVPKFVQPALAQALAASPTARSLWQLLLASPAYVRVVPQRRPERGMVSEIYLTESGKLIQTVRYPLRLEALGPAGNLALVAALFHELAHGVEILACAGAHRLLGGRGGQNIVSSCPYSCRRSTGMDYGPDASAILRGLITSGAARQSGFGRHETQFALEAEARIVTEMQGRAADPRPELVAARGSQGQS